MITGMALIGVGLAASLYGLVPAGAGEIRQRAARIQRRAHSTTHRSGGSMSPCCS